MLVMDSMRTNDRKDLYFSSQNNDNDDEPLLGQDGEQLNDVAVYESNSSCCTQLKSRLQLSPKWRCYKNLALHSISCFMVFTSFLTFQSLDSSLNDQHGLGVLSFTVLYGGFIISCIVAPAIVRQTGCKNAMLMCFIMQIIFALSHLYPRFYTLLPCALLLGLTLGPFWTAQGVYIVSLSAKFSRITGKEYEVIVGRFYGVFNFFILSGQKFGNLMESLILEKHGSPVLPVLTNTTHCGSAYCPSSGKTAHSSPHEYDKFFMNILIGIYAALCFIGFIVKAGFVDDITKEPVFEEEEEEENGTESVRNNSVSLREQLKDIVSALAIHKKNLMFLFLPLFFYSGLQQGFIYGDYTKSFVSCELGLQQIGYIMLVYGYADAFSSLLVGCIQKHVGRLALFTVAMLIQTTLVAFMEIWTVDINQKWVLYVLPAFWGMGDAVWQTTISSTVGVLFYEQKDAAFACFRLWQAAGLGAAFAYSHVLCTWQKLYIILGVMFVAVLTYYVMECVKRRRRPISISSH